LIGEVLRVRYELTQLISEGPIFSLYAAKDRSFGREVSVRLVKAPFSQEPDFIGSLQDAVKRSHAVNHPGVERLQELDEGDGIPFLLGELSKGATLGERIKKLAPYSVPVSIAMTVSILEGLEALHRAGIVHGDINSQNIVLLPDGSAKLQLAGIWQTYSASATAGSVVLPSMAAYLAPEISSGSMPSPSSDVYAVGIILFQLLTGRQPYIGDTPVAVAMKHSTTPTPPVRMLNPSVPTALDEVIKKAMAKDPSERYVSAREMLADLRVIEDAVRFGRPVAWPIRKSEPSAAPAAQQVAPTMSAAREKPKKEPRPEKEERDVPVWMMVLFAAVVGVAACMFGLWVYFNLSTPRLVTVPQIQGLTQAEAKSMLSELDLSMRIGGRASSERIAADSVLEVNPAPGDKVREGGTVTVQLSSGSKFVEVPDLRGRTVDAAKSLLSSLDLSVDDSVDTVRDFSVKEGLIVKQRPEPRLKVERFTKVKLSISGGRSGAATNTQQVTQAYDYTLNIRLTQLTETVVLRVDITDLKGSRTVYEKRHQPDDEVEVSAKGYGPNAVFRIFYDDNIVRTLQLDAEEDATPATADAEDEP
jgi:hypothetical protein